MTQSLAFPPFFVSGWPYGGKPALEMLVWPGEQLDDLPSLPGTLKIVAPNGAMISLKAGGASSAVTYEALFERFSESGYQTLWVKDWEVESGSCARPGERIGLCLYSGGEPSAGATAFAVDKVAGVTGTYINDRHTSVLSWTSEGPAVVVHTSRGDFLYHAPGRPGRERRLRTLALPADVRVAAYWYFAQSAVFRACKLLVEEAFERDIASIVEWPEDLAIIAADYALHHKVKDPRWIGALTDRLSASQSTDAAIALFCLSHDRVFAQEDQATARHFTLAMDKLSIHQCRHTAMFKAFLERFGEALELWGKGSRDEAQSARCIQRVFRLAETAYWDGVYLSYRGTNPGNPEKSATGHDVPAAAKKKFGAN